MVVPVTMSSEKEVSAKVVDNSIGSYTSVTEKAISEVVSLVPSEAVRVRV